MPGAGLLNQSTYSALAQYPGPSGPLGYPEMATVAYEAGPLPPGGASYVIGSAGEAIVHSQAIAAAAAAAAAQYNPYGYLPAAAMAGNSSAYGTLQNSRRVRIIPPGVGPAGAGVTVGQSGLTSPATSLVSPVPSLSTTTAGTSSPLSMVQHRTSAPDTQGPMTEV